MLLMVGSAAGFIASKKASESIPFFNNLDEKTKQDIVKNLSKNIQSGIMPATMEQRNKEEQNRILQYMMKQKQQEAGQIDVSGSRDRNAATDRSRKLDELLSGKDSSKSEFDKYLEKFGKPTVPMPKNWVDKENEN
jgi:hypothetical protein